MSVRKITVLVVLATLTFAGHAQAAPPTLNSVTHQNRHPAASFSTPRASSVTIYLATKPDRATDGKFLSENVKDSDFFTDSEIQTGSWLYEQKVDPGTYYVMLLADAESSCTSYPPPSYERVVDPACADGFSQVVMFVIPKPVSRYSVQVSALRSIGIVHLTLRAAPLGEDRPYRLCWRLKSKKRVCVRGTLEGHDWSDATSDFLRVNARGMTTFTTFAWYVGSNRVASKRVRVR